MGYKVQKGDGWYKIAKNTGMDVNELLKLNNATLNTTIHPGQEIKVSKTNNTNNTSDKTWTEQSSFTTLIPKKKQSSKSMPTPYRSDYTKEQYVKDNAKSVQQQLINAGYDLGKYGADGKWGKVSQDALDKALADGYKLENGKLSKPSLKPRSKTVQDAASDKVGEWIDSGIDTVKGWVASDEDGPKNRINIFRWPNKVLSEKPAVINGEVIDACAKYGNCKLSQQGYISNGHAWTRHNNQRTIYSGYNVKNRPKTYDVDAVVKYNSEAADNVVKDFDFNNLDKDSIYTVGMYYKGSPAQEQAYNEGVDGATNTHTGNLFWSPEHDSWVVEHNIHGTAITNELQDVIGSRGKYGITGIYQPYKANMFGRVASFGRSIN